MDIFRRIAIHEATMAIVYINSADYNKRSERVISIPNILRKLGPYRLQRALTAFGPEGTVGSWKGCFLAMLYAPEAGKLQRDYEEWRIENIRKEHNVPRHLDILSFLRQHIELDEKEMTVIYTTYDSQNAKLRKMTEEYVASFNLPVWEQSACDFKAADELLRSISDVDLYAGNVEVSFEEVNA